MLFVSILKTIRHDVTPAAWSAASSLATPLCSCRRGHAFLRRGLDGRELVLRSTGSGRGLARQSSECVFFLVNASRGTRWQLWSYRAAFEDSATYCATQGAGHLLEAQPWVHAQRVCMSVLCNLNSEKEWVKVEKRQQKTTKNSPNSTGRVQRVSHGLSGMLALLCVLS